MAQFNFFTYGLALVVVTLFIGDSSAFSAKGRKKFSLTPRAIYDFNKEEHTANAIKEIMTPMQTLTDESINSFADIVNSEYNGKYEMIDITYFQNPEFYEMYVKPRIDTDDVQVFYGGALNSATAIGHYICVFYKHSERRVYIYDPLFLRNVLPEQRSVINYLYPNAKYLRFVKPKTKQPDSSSCGVFSIAYATSLILGQDPKNTALKLGGQGDRTMTMRGHLKKILQDGKLSSFPQVRKVHFTENNATKTL